MIRRPEIASVQMQTISNPELHLPHIPITDFVPCNVLSTVSSFFGEISTNAVERDEVARSEYEAIAGRGGQAQ